MERDSRAVVVALIVTLGFAAARAIVYDRIPVEVPCVQDPGCREWAAREPRPAEALAGTTLSPEAWVRRDVIMTGPRLLALLICLAAMSALGGLRGWRWSGSPSQAAYILLGTTAAWSAVGFLGAGDKVFSGSQAIRGILATVPVALWEEACYRGLLYRGLRAQGTARSAAVVSSAVFMVMHLQAQPYIGWPFIFCFGVVACAAAEEGAGLWLLIFVHWFVDTVVFFCPSGSDGQAVLATALIAATAYTGLERLRPRSALVKIADAAGA